MESETFNICCGCIGEEYLKAEIKSDGQITPCNCCGKTGVSAPIEWLALRVKEAIDIHFQYVPSEPDGIPRDLLKEGWERSGEPLSSVIQELLAVESGIAELVREFLEKEFGTWDGADCDDPWSSDAQYEQCVPDGAEYMDAWHDLEKTLRYESRYFNKRAEEVLQMVFDGAEAGEEPFGLRSIEVYGPNHVTNEIFRARLARNETELKDILAAPEQQMAPPPTGKATAGRMNATGITVFYGANALKTAIAEVRPPVGSRVVCARFAFTRDVKVLKLFGFDQKPPVGSVFDPTYTRRLKQMRFLRHLTSMIAKPVLPGEEATEYVITQAVAEFLSQRFDGLAFASSQAGEGFNIVLFKQAGEVTPAAPLVPGTSIDVGTVMSTSDGFETDYTVHARISNGQAPTANDPRVTTKCLQLDRNSLTVHHIEAVSYKFEQHSVTMWESNDGSCEF